MHHVKHVRHSSLIKNNQNSPNTKQIMQLRNNKQIPLCENCHADVHAGKYNGPSFKTYDSRLSNLEMRIVPAPYKAPPDLEAKLLEKNWVEYEFEVKQKTKLQRKK